MAKRVDPATRRRLAAQRRKRRAKIEVVLERLGERYEHPAWSGSRLDPIEELVLTILAQNTADVNSHRAFVALRERYPTWEAVLEAPTDELVEVIRPGGLAPTKAPRIQQVLVEILDRRGELSLDFLRELSVVEAREWLTSLPGIGRKTASIVLLFCFAMPSLPVDTHIFRVAHRIGLIPPRTDLLRAHQLLEEALEPDEMYAFHVETIRHGRDTCRAPRPICAICPLTDICDYYRLVQRGKAATAPPPKLKPDEERPPRYHDELIHGWAPPEGAPEGEPEEVRG